ncbi:hypothetical protein C8Q76DRAFT_26120 [Earliella scabrosa]|nr:hypothetical protein C8Q76DRAFT_26120 [Earliella scabrosa]
MIGVPNSMALPSRVPVRRANRRLLEEEFVLEPNRAGHEGEDEDEDEDGREGEGKPSSSTKYPAGRERGSRFAACALSPGSRKFVAARRRMSKLGASPPRTGHATKSRELLGDAPSALGLPHRNSFEPGFKVWCFEASKFQPRLLHRHRVLQLGEDTLLWILGLGCMHARAPEGWTEVSRTVPRGCAMADPVMNDPVLGVAPSLVTQHSSTQHSIALVPQATSTVDRRTCARALKSASPPSAIACARICRIRARACGAPPTVRFPMECAVRASTLPRIRDSKFPAAPQLAVLGLPPRPRGRGRCWGQRCSFDSPRTVGSTRTRTRPARAHRCYRDLPGCPSWGLPGRRMRELRSCTAAC